MNYGNKRRPSLTRTTRLGGYKKFSLLTGVLGLASLAMMFTNTIAQDLTTIHQGELISDQHLEAKQRAHYHLKITSNIYKGQDHLAISAFAASFNSDPDVYISKSLIPFFASQADLACTRDGTDVCIMQQGSFEVGDNIYITVYCRQECEFDIRAYYAKEQEIRERERMNFRWGGHSVAILKYYVPELSGEGFTDSFNIKVEPEQPYAQIDVFVSFDNNFNIMEDRPAQHILQNGQSVLVNEGEPNWCKKCWVYLVVVMMDDMRLYVTADATARIQGISRGVYKDLMVNEGQFECFSYSVGSINNDVMFGISHYQGNSDIYIARRNQPSTIASSAIKMSSVMEYPRQVLIVTRRDRSLWAAEIGQYYFCLNTFASVSAQALIEESEYNGVYPAHKDTMYTYNLMSQSSMQLVYQQNELFTNAAFIEIEASVWTVEGGDLTKIKIFYTICNYEDDDISCRMPEEDANGSSGLVEQLDLTEEVESHGDPEALEVTTSLKYKGRVEHLPSVCGEYSTCKYIFSIYNPSVDFTPRKATFMVHEIIHNDIQVVKPGESYRNTVHMGQYIYYSILDSHYDLEYIEELSLDLLTYMGDADIFVSTSRANRFPSIENYDKQSRNSVRFDQVKLTDTVNVELSDHIFIAIYGNVRSDFELQINVKLHPHFNEKLEYAMPLVERIPIHVVFKNEWAQLFTSFTPLWSMHEDKTVIIMADSLVNDVTFYLAVDDYPLIYQTKLIARNEMFSITPKQPHYTLAEGHRGTYYIRIRPNYSLSDVVVDDPYEFDFVVFSQPFGNGLTDLYAGQNLVGAAWRGQNTYYRHFLTDINHTVLITLRRIKNKGSPKLMVKFKDVIMLPKSDQPNTYDQKLQTDENNDFVQMWLHKDIRAREDPDCDFAGYYIAGGREYCGIYIGVECGDDEAMCAFTIELDLLEWTEDFTVFQDEELTQERIVVEPKPPRYIPKDQDYVEGMVSYQEDMQFYYPVVPEESGDVLILVNKTGPIHENGDLSLGMNIQADANKNYTDWNLPTGRRNTARSRTFDPVQPEIINMSEQKLKQACNDVLSNCAVLINVRGESKSYDSHFKLKVFNGTNRLYPNEPIEDAILVQGEYKYYWFVSTAAMAATLEVPNWLHEIGLGVKTPGQDVDMFLSVMDGRFPTEEDYDYRSVNLGSDWITISNNDTVLRNANSHSWNPRVGMVVVVGVRARYSGASAYSLVLKGPDKTFYDMTTLSTNNYEQVDIDPDPTRSKKKPVVKVYKWFNWQHVDFKLNVKITTGSAHFFLNSIGENNYEENAVSGIPLGPANSQWSTFLNRTDNFWQDSVTVLKIDTQSIPQFCYTCWYYLTVKIVDPAETTYRVFFQEVADSGYNYLTLELDSSTEIEIEEQGERKYCRFLLESKNAFKIELYNSVGYTLVNVGPDPDSVDFDPIWSEQFGVGNRVITVGKNDPRFDFATWYYISIQSLRGSAVSYVKVIQDRQISVLANGYGQKFQYLTEHEHLKYMVFAVPSFWSFNFKTSIDVEQLGDLVYPTIYLKKIELEDIPDDLSKLSYPSIVDYDLVFGDNISYQLYNDKAHYEFEGTTILEYTYYTMAVYSNIYGMTDMRKPNFKLTVTSEEVPDETQNNPIVNPLQGPHMPLLQD